jgi:hypothetical protein
MMLPRDNYPLHSLDVVNSPLEHGRTCSLLSFSSYVKQHDPETIQEKAEVLERLYNLSRCEAEVHGRATALRTLRTKWTSVSGTLSPRVHQLIKVRYKHSVSGGGIRHGE